MWIVFAFGAAFFAGVTSILGKAGVKTTPSSLATALRTIVVLAFAALMVALAGSAGTVGQIAPKTWVFLVASGAATGASWLCFFRALQLGPAAKVAVIDKSSIVITVLLAIVVLGETHSLGLRLAGVALIALGTWLMIERKPAGEENDAPAKPGDERLGRGAPPQPSAPTAATAASASTPAGRGWLGFALGAAVFAALTAILGKVGIEDVESNLGTLIRTVVVLVMAFIVVAVKGEWQPLSGIARSELAFIALSGLATGASWLCYWKAMQDGPASVVAPIDKLSILVTVLFAWLAFGEKQSRRALVGLDVLAAGTLVMVLAG